MVRKRQPIDRLPAATPRRRGERSGVGCSGTASWQNRRVESSRRPRNPFRSEADAFRVLMMFVVAGALVVVAAVLIGGLAGVLVALVLLGVGAWRAWGLLQTWRREGSDPDPDAREKSGGPPG